MSKKKRKKFKRENGSGSVYQLSGNRRNPWVASITLGWQEGNDMGEGEKQIQKSLGSFETEDKAALVLLRFNDLSDILLKKGFSQQKIYTVFHSIVKENKKDWEALVGALSLENILSILNPDRKLVQAISENSTVEQLYKIIYENAIKDKLSKSTLRVLQASYKSIESLKDESLFELSSIDFQFIIDSIIEDPNEKSSFAKLNKIKSLVSKMYNILIMHKITGINHAQFISLRGKKDGDVPPFPERDIQTLLKNDDDRIAKSSLILAYTGLRISEFLELRKFLNVDLKRWLIVGGNKTEAGKDRAIAIHPIIQPYVEYFFYEFPDCEYLFSRNGERVTGDYYRKYCHVPMVEKLGLSNLNPHSFRHTAASKMKMAGLDNKAITDMIGHTSIDFTDKRYVDVDENYLHEQMKKVK